MVVGLDVLCYADGGGSVNVEVGGLGEAARLCKKGVSRRLLSAACTILVTLIPSPEEIKVCASV